MSTQTQAVVKAPPAPIEKKIESALLLAQPQIDMVRARHLTPERMVRVTMMALTKTPDLKACDPMTIVSSVMEAASLGLEAGGPLQHGYLIPRKNKNLGTKECTFMPSYRGLIELARRSGQIKSIGARVVFENDIFRLNYTGDKTNFFHEPNLDNPGNAKLYYASAVLTNDGIEFEVMTKAQIEEIKKRSEAGSGPWVTDYNEMAKKTCLRRLMKRLPMSTELADAIAKDDTFYEAQPAMQVTTTAKAEQLRAQLEAAKTVEEAEVVTNG